jgi:hypothetical protein
MRLPGRPRGAGPALGRAARAAALLASALLGTAGCAEVTRPPPPPPPAGLAAIGTADPVRASLDAAAAAFADRGAALAGRPAEAAQAAAQLEHAAAGLPRDPRYARLADGVGRELALARSELRDALGVAEAADPAAVSRALLSAADRLRAGDRAGAARALPAPMFRPGGAASVARLGELGPLPQAAVATAFAQQAVARVDAMGLGGSTQMPETTFGIGSVTTSFGGSTGQAGY